MTYPETTLMSYCEDHVDEEQNWQGDYCADCLRQTLVEVQDDVVTLLARTKAAESAHANCEIMIENRDLWIKQRDAKLEAAEAKAARLEEASNYAFDRVLILCAGNDGKNTERIMAQIGKIATEALRETEGGAL